MFFKPKEFEFCCQKCGAVWYATQKDIDESNKLKNQITLTKMNNFGFHTVKTHAANQAQISQMKMAYRDYKQCPSCGSRDVVKH